MNLRAINYSKIFPRSEDLFIQVNYCCNTN